MRASSSLEGGPAERQGETHKGLEKPGGVLGLREAWRSGRDGGKRGGVDDHSAINNLKELVHFSLALKSPQAANSYSDNSIIADRNGGVRQAGLERGQGSVWRRRRRR